MTRPLSPRRFPAALSLLLLAAAPAAFAQDDPAPEPTPDTPAGAPEPDAPQEEVTPDEKTDDEQPPADDAEPAGDAETAEMKDDGEGADEGEEEGEEKDAEPKAVVTELLVQNLETPTGLAISPQSGDVLVATRYGVYRYQPKPHAVFIEVEGYDDPDVMGEDGGYEIGPLSLDFYGDSELVVGGGAKPAGEEIVQTFEIGLEPRGDDPQIADQDGKQSAGPVPADVAGGEGAGNFVGVAVGDAAIYVSTSGTTPKGWILKIPVNPEEDGKFGDIEPGIATAEVAGVGGPGPLAWDADEHLVVGLWGGPDRDDDAIGVFDVATGELVKKYDVDIAEFGGMAYSPAGDLYVTDMGLTGEETGGIYKVTFDGDAATATKLGPFTQKQKSGNPKPFTPKVPAALVFDADGKLYLTTLGEPGGGETGDDGEEMSAGGLHLIESLE